MNRFFLSLVTKAACYLEDFYGTWVNSHCNQGQIGPKNACTSKVTNECVLVTYT